MGEFALIGFRFTMTFPSKLQDDVWDVFQHYADLYNLQYGGGMGYDTQDDTKCNLDLFICEEYPNVLTSYICASIGESLERIGCESEDMRFYNFVDAMYGDFDEYFK